MRSDLYAFGLLLYELVTADTHETFTSERRREHSAYR